MKLLRSALAAVALASALAPTFAFGAGYAIYEQGAAVLGMAGAGTASVHDASAVFYNPANLVTLDGKSFYVGGTWLSTHNSFAGVAPNPGFGVTEEMNTGNFFPPMGYWTNRLSKRWAYGAGVNAPFGLGVDWANPESFTGRARVTKATLEGINANLSLAFAVTPEFSIAGGFNALYAGVEVNQVATQVIPGGGGGVANIANVKLKGGLTPGYGWNTALSWRPSDKWAMGAYYRSHVHVAIDDGDATFTQILTGDTLFDAVVAAGLPPAQGVSTTLEFPAMFSGGVAWHPVPNWTWEMDVNFTQWSAFEELPITFAQTTSKNVSIREDYEDSWRVSVGAEHQLPRYTYRFGYYYDQQAAPIESVTPLLPDAPRHGVTVGLGWKLGAKKNWTLDAYNLALFVENRSTEGQERDGYNGTYKAYVNGTGLSLAYHW
ncbi:MAG: outer membrane protein transport protein [Candidatus Eisenbacteria bacterium]